MTNERGLTRREFNAAGLGLGAAAALGPAALARAAWGSRRDTIKVGVVGCGGRGTGAVVQALRADEGAVLWAMGDLYAERVAACEENARAALADDDADADVSHRFAVDDARRFAGFDAYRLVIESGVDVVLLTTPPVFRPTHLRAAITAGLHVFCEKPVAVDGPGVRSVIETSRIARDRGLSIMSGFCWRCHDQVCEVFDRLADGGVGTMRAIQTTYNTTGWVRPNQRQPEWSETEFQLRNWQYFTPLSGDHIVEQAVHAIDWMSWAMGDVPPLRCWAIGGRQVRPEMPETGNVFDHFGVTYEYEGGVRGYHTCRHWPNTPSDNSAVFMGSDGVCTMQPWQGRHVIEGARAWVGSAGGNDMYQREHDLLFKALRAGEAINDGELMAQTTLLAIMGRMAAYTGQTVTWDQAMNSEEDLNPGFWAFGKRERPEVAVPGVTELK